MTSSNGHGNVVLETEACIEMPSCPGNEATSQAGDTGSHKLQHGGMELSVSSPSGRVHVLLSKDGTSQQSGAGAHAAAIAGAAEGKVPEASDSFINLLSSNQNKRINDQRYEWPRATSREESLDSVGMGAQLDDAHGLDDIFDMLIRSQVILCVKSGSSLIMNTKRGSQYVTAR